MGLFGGYGNNNDWVWIAIIIVLIFVCGDGNLFGNNNCCDPCCERDNNCC